jgi:hypothetical protein
VIPEPLHETEGYMYRFKALTDSTILPDGVSDLLDSFSLKMASYINQGKYGIYMAEFRGSILQLFGQPHRITKGFDEAYEYIIEASDDNNIIWILLVTQGAGGPYIGGDIEDASIYPVAERLLSLIENTPPSDFEAVIYNSDTKITAIYGCREGTCYWREIS